MTHQNTPKVEFSLNPANQSEEAEEEEVAGEEEGVEEVVEAHMDKAVVSYKDSFANMKFERSILDFSISFFGTILIVRLA